MDDSRPTCDYYLSLVPELLLYIFGFVFRGDPAFFYRGRRVCKTWAVELQDGRNRPKPPPLCVYWHHTISVMERIAGRAREIEAHDNVEATQEMLDSFFGFIWHEQLLRAHFNDDVAANIVLREADEDRYHNGEKKLQIGLTDACWHENRQRNTEVRDSGNYLGHLCVICWCFFTDRNATAGDPRTFENALWYEYACERCILEPFYVNPEDGHKKVLQHFWPTTTVDIEHTPLFLLLDRISLAAMVFTLVPPGRFASKLKILLSYITIPYRREIQALDM